MDYKKLIIKKYEKSVSTNLSDIKKILGVRTQKFNNISDYRNLLITSSKSMVIKWKSNKKYLRTEFVLRAFVELYPVKLIEQSIMVDAMINILDDLLDSNLDKQDKMLYILEYLRVFSIYNFSLPSLRVQKVMGNYFDKLITLAVAEFNYQEEIVNENIFDKKIQLSTELLLMRAMDIDVFVQIPLTKENLDIETNTISAASKVFRAGNILKKDLLDIDIDKKQGQATLITYIYDKHTRDMKGYIHGILGLLESRMDSIIKRGINRRSKTIRDNFRNMFIEQKDEIDKIITKLVK